MTILLSPAQKAVLTILTDRQRAFLYEEEHAYDENKIDWAHLERMRMDDYTYPLKHTFSWKTDQKSSRLEIAEDQQFCSPRVIQTDETQVSIHNFKANTTYFWRVNNSEIRCFTTEDIVPRWIEAKGLTNIRDAGNWKTAYGCRIKQGMLFRGSEMDIHHTITPEGKRVLCEDLKIKTDLDLRGEGLQLPESPMGKDIRLAVIPIGPYTHLMTADGKQKCKELFDFFSNPLNYPIYYHCWGGADRTGTLAFLLGVVLGMCEKDLILDYELTSLAIWGDRSRKSELFQGFVKELGLYAGNTLSEQAYSFLLSCGITESQMQKIRTILLDQ